MTINDAKRMTINDSEANDSNLPHAARFILPILLTCLALFIIFQMANKFKMSNISKDLTKKMFIRPGNFRISLWLFIVLFSMLTNTVLSQQKAELSFGIGLPDLVNMKVKFGNNVQLYGGAGFLPKLSLSSLTTGVDIHFPMKSTKDKTRKFYLNNGIAFFPSAASFSDDGEKMVMWFSRIGFSFYNSHKKDLSGFDFDIGFMVETGPEELSYGAHVTSGTRQVIQGKKVIGPSASLSYFFVL